MDAYGLVLVDRACNVLCYLTYSHPDAVEPFLAADGVALVTRVMQVGQGRTVWWRRRLRSSRASQPRRHIGLELSCLPARSPAARTRAL